MADSTLKPFTGELDAPSARGLQPFSGTLDGEPPKRTLAGTAGDIGVTALKGAVGLPQAAVGLADIPTGGQVGKALEGAGLRFKDAQDALDTMYSPAQQEANRKVREADGFVGTAKAMLENPSTIATGIGESLPQMLGGAGVARGILKAAPAVGPVLAGAAGEGVMGAGSAAEQIRQQTADGLLTPGQAALAGASGLATAALGAAGGKVAQRLGVGDVDTMLAQGAARAAGPGSARSMPRQVLEGAIAEGALEELPQSVAEQALQNAALNRPVDEGLGAAAAQGLIAGAAMGGAGGGIGARGNRAQARAEAAAVQREQAANEADPSRTWTTQPGAADPNAPTQAAAPTPETPDLQTSPGAGVPREPGIDFQRQVDTSGLRLEDPAAPAVAPSALMGIDPAAGPLSRVAALAVDTGAAQEAQFIAATGRDLQVRTSGPGVANDANVIDVQGRLLDDPAIETPRRLTTDQQLQEVPNAQAATPVLAGPSPALPAPGATAVEAAGAPSAAAEPGVDASASTQPVLDGGPAAQRAGPAAAVAPAATVAPERAENWRTSMLRARPVAQALGIDTKGKRLAQVVAEVDAADAARAGRPQDGADLTAGQIDREWNAFAPETGTLGIPRAQMPQVRAEHRGALVNFLQARGIDSLAEEVPANDLKPTQAEFSPAKVRKAMVRAGGDRSILVSSDGYVVDGHHQWLAKRAAGEPVKVIRLDAPIRQVLQQVSEFPSVAASNGANTSTTGARDDQSAPAAPDLRVADERLGGAGDLAPAGGAFRAAGPGDLQGDQFGGRGRADSSAPDPVGRADVPAAGDAGQQVAGVTQSAESRPGAGTVGREVFRDTGKFKEGMSEFRANQVRAELARKNPGVIYTVEEDAGLKNGFAVVGREPGPGQKLGRQRMLAAKGRPVAQDAEAPRPGPQFSRAPGYDAAVDAAINAGMKGESPGRQPVAIGSTPGALRAAGIPDGPLRTSPTILAKAVFDHGVTKSVLKRLPDLLEKPVMVFDSDTVAGRYVVVTSEFVQGQPLIVAVSPESTTGPVSFNFVPSLYPKNDLGAIGRWMSAGRLRYLDKEQSPQWLGSTRLQLPGEFRSAKGLQAANVATNDDSVKFRRDGADIRTALQKVSDARLVATQQLVDGLTERWANKPEIVVARNMEDEQIPQLVREYNAKLKSQGATGEPRGFILQGKVFLLADQLQGPRQIAEVLFHETLGHYGLRRAFGDRLVPILEQVARMRRADMRAKAKEYGLDLKSEEGRLIAAEEVLAEMAQTNPQMGLVQRAISAIRNWLRAHVPGFGALKLTDADIVQGYLLPARGAVTRQSESMEQSLRRAMGAFEGNDVVPAFSRGAAVVTDGYSPAQLQAAEKVFGADVKQTLAQRAQSMRANLGTKLRQGLVDQFAPIKEVSQQAYMLARLSKGSDGAVEAALLYGKPFLRDGVADVNIQDGGFAKVLASLKGEHDRFFQWVAAQRAERLKAEGRENLLTDQDISALRTLNAGQMADGTARMPLYAAALRELNAFNEASLKVALESGLIDQAAYELMKDQPYVPFYRLMEDGDMRGPRFSSGLVNQKAWKKLKGGTQQINADLLQNTLMNWSHLYAAAARNRASLATMAEAEKLGIAYRVPADTKGAVKVMRDGVAEHWAVEDPYLLEAISALNYTPPGMVKALAPFKRLLTFGVTVNPTFKIRNLIRDSLSAIAQSDLSYNPAENVAKGWKATGRGSQTYASMLASGGIIKFGTQENTNHLRGQIERLGGTMLDKQGWEKLAGQMRNLWETYEEFGDRLENVNRTALYERLRAKGLSHAEASFQARDLMDFSMSGKWEAVRFLAQTVPFLNARLQGLYKLGRAAGEDPRRFAAMAGAVSMASLALLAAYGDDDDWKKREDWDRDNFWWFKVGDTAFRIPKPFEVGAIGTVAERTAELMLSEEMTGKRFGQRISDMVFNTFAMDPTPQAIKPFLDVYANKDSFSGRAIEGMADERLRPQDRYNERTSEVARLLGSWGLPDPVRLAKGEYSGLSPKQIDFLMRGYFGWLATVTTTATDAAARPLLDRGERPAGRLRDAFLVGNFAESLPSGSSRYVSTMYEQAKEVEQAWASYQAAIKSGDVELARSIQAEESSKLRNRQAIANAKQQISEIGQQAKRIESSRVLSAEQKREQLDALEARRHAVAARLPVLQ